MSYKNKHNGFISIGIIIASVVFLILALVLVPPTLKMSRLQHEANKRADILNEISFVQGKNTEAEGLVNGDWLTAQDDQQKSSFASAIVEVDTTFNDSFNYVDKNLAEAGFDIDDTESGLPYFQLSSGYGTSSKDSTSSIVFRYLNTQIDEGITVRYVFSKDIKCPKDKNCTNSISSPEPDDLINYETLLNNQKVEKLDLDLAHESNDYLLRRGF